MFINTPTILWKLMIASAGCSNGLKFVVVTWISLALTPLILTHNSIKIYQNSAVLCYILLTVRSSALDSAVCNSGVEVVGPLK